MHIHRSAYFMILSLIAAVLSAAVPVAAQGQKPSAGAAAATPQTADGKPNLSGYWGRLTGDGATLPTTESNASIYGPGNRHSERVDPKTGKTVPMTYGEWLTQFELDGILNRRRETNPPIYRPEHWALIRETDWNHSRANDPNNNCLPSVPRLRAPQKIVQLPNEIIFFYESTNRFRIIPTDGRERNPVKVANLSWFGDSVGRWEGDTLVVETIGLIDQSWLGPNGYLHTDETRVTERVRRMGNVLRIETTVEDPMLLEPWEMDPIEVTANTNPKAQLWEELPCDERGNDAVKATQIGK